MIAAPLLLLIGVSGPAEIEGNLVAQVTPAARPSPTATMLPQLTKKPERRPRALRRSQRHDITETLRAMSLMRVGIEPAPEQRASPNQ